MADPADWERILVARLYRAQETILWAHKLPLRPAAIRIVDSEVFWGRWNPLTREISLSRKLLKEHSWFEAQSVLRHEIAHQLAHEAYGAESHVHDELFRKCCEQVGVPDSFARASASLQESALGWKSERREERTEKLLGKVEKLLALATSSNEHEALSAMEKVRALYARHNLDEALRRRETGASGGRGMVHLVICHGKKRIEAHQSKICGILVGHFFVEVLYCQEHDAATGGSFQAMELIGTRENVLMAEYVYHFLLRQTDSLVEAMREERKARGGRLSRMEARSYRLGILQGFSERLGEADREHIRRFKAAPREAEASDAVGRALTVLRSDRTLRDYLERLHPRLRTRAGGAQTVDAEIYFAGSAAGRKVTLHRGVASSVGNAGRLLGHSRPGSPGGS